MTETVEEIARTSDMPTWKVADAMVKLMMRGQLAAPENTTVEDHAAWLKATYPKPENVIGENAKPTVTPYQRGHEP